MVMALNRSLAICCALSLTTGQTGVLAHEFAAAPPTSPPATTPPAGAPPAASDAGAATPKLPPEQLESLVAPIALYPDPLLAQVLVASTYPLEIVQLQQWLTKNPGLKDKALADAVAKQPWDTSIQSMAATPEAVKRLADDVQWTTDLGNAFLADQAGVMDAVQRMRKKAQDKGALESNDQQKVDTKVVENKTVIVVESANPEVIYVPSYSPTVVYGAPMYPYPPIYYPPYPPGAAFVSFSIGVMWGAAIWGGSCCGCGWGGNDVNINVNNNFNKINNVNGGNRGGSGNWQHNPQHRGGTPYGDKATASKYGGSGRGDSRGAGQPSASQRGGTPSAQDRAAGGGDRGGAPTAQDRSASGGANRAAPSSAGGDRVGNRTVPQSSGSNRGGGFGSSSGYSGNSARSNSSRGASSMGGRGGGGGGRRR